MVVYRHHEAAIELLREHLDVAGEEGVRHLGEVGLSDLQPPVRVINHEQRLSLMGAKDRHHPGEFPHDLAAAETFLDLLGAALRLAREPGIGDQTRCAHVPTAGSLAAVPPTNVGHSRLEFSAFVVAEGLRRVARNGPDDVLCKRPRLGDRLGVGSRHRDPDGNDVGRKVLDEWTQNGRDHTRLSRAARSDEGDAAAAGRHLTQNMLRLRPAGQLVESDVEEVEILVAMGRLERPTLIQLL